jgi:Uma2 family endonuclease
MMATLTRPQPPGYHPPRRLWTVAEYERFIALGVFGPEERLELINGEIIEKMPQGPSHANTVDLCTEVLRNLFGAGVRVRVQVPLRFTDSIPEPDVAIVEGGPRDFVNQHPTTALLVVEISDSTLDFDRETKGPMYARAGIADYWIVNLNERRVEVRRQPGADGYASVATFGEGESVAPLARPDAPVAVADLLP